MLDQDRLVDTMARAMRDGVVELPPDVTAKLEEYLGKETSETGRMQLGAILEDIKLAHDEGAPLCQDTGMQLWFVKAGHEFTYLSEVVRAIPKAIEKATRDTPLRPNSVDPFTGENPKNNLGHNLPGITIELVEGDGAELYAFPKGGGSENMSALWMLTPAEGFRGLKKRVLQQVQFAGGKPCPPIVIGLGIGGGADIAMKLAKKAILRPLDQPNPDPKLRELEEELLADINALGVGPAGTGGLTTALAVHVEYTMRHPATFPVGMVVQCWCDRRAKLKVTRDGEVVY
jgi:fumarate hydratase subunit alpha